jgi:hypothetical protein
MEKRLYFGVKSINGFFDVKEIRLPEEVSRVSEFDFILEDVQHDDFSDPMRGIYNQAQGSIRVMTDFGNKNVPLNNGWKLLRIIIDGISTSWELQDKLGEKYLYHYNLGDTNYKQNKPIFVRESLNKVRDFTTDYLSAKHHLFISGKSVYFPDTLNPLKRKTPAELLSLIDKIKIFTNNYQDVLSFLKEEKAPQEMIYELNSTYDKKISPYLSHAVTFN